VYIKKSFRGFSYASVCYHIDTYSCFQIWLVSNRRNPVKYVGKFFWYVNILVISYVVVQYCSILFAVRVQLKYDGTRLRTGGEVKGKLANGVGSQYLSHSLVTWLVSSITTTDALISAASSRLKLMPPADLKLTRPFRRETKSGFCRVPSHFKTQFTRFLSMYTYWLF
jgi:hypothetical protein